MILVEIFHKIYPVFLAGLIFGAGLPTLYALGVRLLSGKTLETADGAVQAPVSPLAKGVAYLLFGFLALAILAGILWIANDFIYAYTGLDIYGTAH